MKLEKANREYLAFLTSRPDQWTSHYNLGNYYLNRGDLIKAQNSFETAVRLEPRATLALVNASIVYAQMGDNTKALKSLQKALKIPPENATANFNMGLLKAELQDFKMSEKYLRATLKADPKLAEVAYNLSILLSKDRLSEAIEWSKKAFELRSNARYEYTFAYYVYQNKEFDRAAQILHQIIQQWPAYGDTYLLLSKIYQKQGKIEKALSIYHQALNKEGLSEQDRYRLQS